MIRVEVVRAWPRRHVAEMLMLPDGATVADALGACAMSPEGISGYAVFGERVEVGWKLNDGDRLELLPPLRIDPREARRRRATGAR